MTIHETSQNFVIQFSYRLGLVELLKSTIPQHKRRWFGDSKKWVISKDGETEVLTFAKRVGAQVVKSGSEEPKQTDYSIPPLPELTIDIALKRPLYDFQKRGVAYALDKKRVIMGDVMGLGKTSQAIATIVAADAFPCLVICPSTLKINWQREIEGIVCQNSDERKALGRADAVIRKPIILNDSIRNSWHKYYEAGLGHFFMVNYESLKKYFVERIDKIYHCNNCRKSYSREQIIPGSGKTLADLCPKCGADIEQAKMRLDHVRFRESIKFFKSVIVDESHRVKSFATQQTKFTRGIAAGKEWVLLLTGTPVVNKPKDLMPQLGIMDRLKDFGGWKNFNQRFCNGYNEASNLKELNWKLNTTCFFRRDKTEVKLPPKVRQIVYCDIDPTHRDEYMHAEADLMKYLEQFKNYTPEQIDKSMRGKVMVRIIRLKEIAARGKLADVVEFVNDTLESGEKLVLFCHLHDVVNRLKEKFLHCVTITGQDTMESRQAAMDNFQTNPNCKLIICSIQAAGVGITLTASSRVAFVELGWHPALHDQCEDRCHRIGSEIHESITCTYFLGKDTIDEWVYGIIDKKRAMTDEITGDTYDVETNVVDQFINLFNQKK